MNTSGFDHDSGYGLVQADSALSAMGAPTTNNPPVAKDDAHSTNEGTTLDVAAPGVLGNDRDADGDSLTAVWVSGPSYGALVLNDDGSFTYTPNSGFSGSDSFTYEASDGSATSEAATVTITVNELTGSEITLDATGYKVKGRQKVDLTWSGATSSNVDVYRDGVVVYTTPNDGSYTDHIDKRGGGSYIHKICETGTTTCSNEVTTTF